MPEIKSSIDNTPAILKYEGFNKALKLFHEASKRVPAYKKFLSEKGINPASIKTHRDFLKIPLTDKDNYFDKYPLHELAWDGNLCDTTVIVSSSGSTGEPMFWPRDLVEEKEVEGYLKYVFGHLMGADKKNTLLVNAFAMGTWSAGIYAVTASHAVSVSTGSLSQVTPGINKKDIFSSIKKLSGSFEQTIIAGYPPFIKDVLTEGETLGIKWKKLNVKLFVAGEAISEEWRDHILEIVGAKNPLRDIINVFGTAEAGLPGIETPSSIAIKRILASSPKDSKRVLGLERTPSIYEYSPKHKYFEVVDGQLIISAPSAVPFIRYNLKDMGGLYSHDEMIDLTGRDKFNKLIKKYASDVKPTKMPFVYLFGRPHNNATIYGLNVYPENIKAGVEDKRVRHHLSGKFKMSTEHDKSLNQYLHIQFELSHTGKVTAKDEAQILEIIKEKLKSLNTEYNKLESEIGTRAHPVLEFFPLGHPDFVTGGIKHKYAVKKK